MFECLRIAIDDFGNVGPTHGLADQDCHGSSSGIGSIGTFPFLILSITIDRIVPNTLTELGCINYPICLNLKKNGFYTVR